MGYSRNVNMKGVCVGWGGRGLKERDSFINFFYLSALYFINILTFSVIHPKKLMKFESGFTHNHIDIPDIEIFECRK